MLKSDVCMYAKHDSRRRMRAFFVCRVCAIHFAGTPGEFPRIEAMLRNFKAGETAILPATAPIVFAGSPIEQQANNAIALPQTQYASELKKIEASDYI